MRLEYRKRNEDTQSSFLTDVESQVEMVTPGNRMLLCQPVGNLEDDDGINSPERGDGRYIAQERLSTSNLSFRPILPRDRTVIQKLHEEWFPVSYQADFYDELVQGRMIYTGDPLFTKVATTIPGDAIVGCVIGSIVNALILSKATQELLLDDVARYPRLFYIMTLGTLPPYRRSGLATSLIYDCINEAQNDEGCGVVYLHVIVSNTAAIRMYEKLGFYRVQEIPNYYSINETYHNCYLYAKYFHGNRGHRSLWRFVFHTLQSIWQQTMAVVAKLNLVQAVEDDQRRER